MSPKTLHRTTVLGAEFWSLEPAGQNEAESAPAQLMLERLRSELILVVGLERGAVAPRPSPFIGPSPSFVASVP